MWQIPENMFLKTGSLVRLKVFEFQLDGNPHLLLIRPVDKKCFKCSWPPAFDLQFVLVRTKLCHTSAVRFDELPPPEWIEFFWQTGHEIQIF
jgi:hypothetical protein